MILRVTTCPIGIECKDKDKEVSCMAKPGNSKEAPVQSQVTGLDLADMCKLEATGPFGMLIFGASGDLTFRKLLPSLLRLMEIGLMPDNFFVLGTSNEKYNDRTFREKAKEQVALDTQSEIDSVLWESFESRLFYEFADVTSPESFDLLTRRLLDLEQKHKSRAKRLFYLAVPPQLFEPIIEGMGNMGLASEDKGYSSIVVEKPFGHDLRSAELLDQTLARYFKESQIFRMDHYLAKETVQNMLMFRFANSIFDPLWNQKYIDHVQISVAETLGVEERAGYYEKSGVIRDMFQNHLFQLLSLAAMEPPSSFDADLIRDEKIKVFRAIQPFGHEHLGERVITGQYKSGVIGGNTVKAYREEKGVSKVSSVATYASLKVYVDNWRWHGVPFYLRSGKRLSRRMAEVSVHFKEVPHMMFLRNVEGNIPTNVLTMRVQPDEGISLAFQTKTQGTKLCLSPVQMDFSYEKAFSLSGYERVLLDCLQGDQTLFVRDDGVRRNWEIFTPLIEAMESKEGKESIFFYEAGSEGPKEASEFIRRDGRQWQQIGF